MGSTSSELAYRPPWPLTGVPATRRGLPTAATNRGSPNAAAAASW
jgi:hypothetical protein